MFLRCTGYCNYMKTNHTILIEYQLVSDLQIKSYIKKFGKCEHSLVCNEKCIECSVIKNAPQQIRY